MTDIRFNSIPPDDRELLLKRLQESEHRQARRLRAVLDKIDLLDARLTSWEDEIIKKGRSNARNAALSSGAIVSALVTIISYLAERFM